MNYPGRDAPPMGGAKVVYYSGFLLLVVMVVVVAVYVLSSRQAFVNQSKNHIAQINADPAAGFPRPAEPTTPPPPRFMGTAPSRLFVDKNDLPVALQIEPPIEQVNQPPASTVADEPKHDSNCPITSSQVEFMICDSAELAQLDNKLLDIETDAVAGAAPEQAGRITYEARHWRVAVRDLCDTIACLQLAYTTRLHEMDVVTAPDEVKLTTVAVASP